MKNSKLYYFVLSCVIYPKEGIFTVTEENLSKIKLDHSPFGVPKNIKNLKEFLDDELNEKWNWDSHSPFDLDSFYEYAECLAEFDWKTCFYVSE